MLAGILSQTSGSSLFPVIYRPITGVPLGLQEEALPHLSLWVTVSSVSQNLLGERRVGTHMSDTMRHLTRGASGAHRLQLVIGRRRVMNLNHLTGAERDKLSATELKRIQKERRI